MACGEGIGPPQVWEGGYGNANGWAVKDYYFGTIRFPDINGDGKADICGRNVNGIVCGTATP